MHSIVDQPLELIRGLRTLYRDPNRTDAAFQVVRSFDRGRVDRVHARFRRDAGGQRLLRERPDLLSALRDRDALRAHPEGSLARAYVSFCEQEGIEASGLVEASDHAHVGELDEERRYIAERLRDSHDLFHVVLGCRTDVSGELSVLAFTAAQTGSLGVLTLAGLGWVRSWDRSHPVNAEGRRMIKKAFETGRRARWLPGAPWEMLLDLPLERVRSRLHVTALPAYRPTYVRAS